MGNTEKYSSNYKTNFDKKNDNIEKSNKTFSRKNVTIDLDDENFEEDTVEEISRKKESGIVILDDEESKSVSDYREKEYLEFNQEENEADKVKKEGKIKSE